MIIVHAVFCSNNWHALLLGNYGEGPGILLPLSHFSVDVENGIVGSLQQPGLLLFLQEIVLKKDSVLGLLILGQHIESCHLQCRLFPLLQESKVRLGSELSRRRASLVLIEQLSFGDPELSLHLVVIEIHGQVVDVDFRLEFLLGNNQGNFFNCEGVLNQSLVLSRIGLRVFFPERRVS